MKNLIYIKQNPIDWGHNRPLVKRKFVLNQKTNLIIKLKGKTHYENLSRSQRSRSINFNRLWR